MCWNSVHSYKWKQQDLFHCSIAKHGFDAQPVQSSALTTKRLKIPQTIPFEAEESSDFITLSEHN